MKLSQSSSTAGYLIFSRSTIDAYIHPPCGSWAVRTLGRRLLVVGYLLSSRHVAGNPGSRTFRAIAKYFAV
jgi:hypothetical protein